jgi:hypothetical protein
MNMRTINKNPCARCIMMWCKNRTRFADKDVTPNLSVSIREKAEGVPGCFDTDHMVSDADRKEMQR